MFTGIVEAKAKVLQAQVKPHAIQILIERPPHFDDIHRGDSVACNGVCLTVEEFDASTMTFTIGHETLLVTAWGREDLVNQLWNLERSLKFGDRIHGHLVSGHVDGLALLTQKQWQGECLVLWLEAPADLNRFIWKKGGVALNGVSLTVNEVQGPTFSVCLIPETIQQTQLASLEVGASLNLEVDYYMKGLLQARGESYEQPT